MVKEYKGKITCEPNTKDFIDGWQNGIGKGSSYGFLKPVYIQLKQFVYK